ASSERAAAWAPPSAPPSPSAAVARYTAHARSAPTAGSTRPLFDPGSAPALHARRPSTPRASYPSRFSVRGNSPQRGSSIRPSTCGGNHADYGVLTQEATCSKLQSPVACQEGRDQLGKPAEDRTRHYDIDVMKLAKIAKALNSAISELLASRPRPRRT